MKRWLLQLQAWWRRPSAAQLRDEELGARAAALAVEEERLAEWQLQVEQDSDRLETLVRERARRLVQGLDEREAALATRENMLAARERTVRDVTAEVERRVRARVAGLEARVEEFRRAWHAWTRGTAPGWSRDGVGPADAVFTALGEARAFVLPRVHAGECVSITSDTVLGPEIAWLRVEADWLDFERKVIERCRHPKFRVGPWRIQATAIEPAQVPPDPEPVAIAVADMLALAEPRASA